MIRVRAAVVGVWTFVVGDEPLVAVGVAVTVAFVAGLSALGVAAWWVMALGVVVVLVTVMARHR